MEAIREYVLGIICAALICGVAKTLIGKEGPVAGAVSLMAGVFLILSVVQPWAAVTFPELDDFGNGFSQQAEDACAQGQNAAREALCLSIKQRTEAYILDKAESLGAQLMVEVSVEGADIPVPCAVRIRGQISPYAKQMLSNLLSQDLGIEPEEQIWILQE